MFGQRMGLKTLADLCRRLGISAETGIDARRTWEREATRGPRGFRRPLGAVSDAVAAGESISHGLAQTGRCFPRLFLEMVDVGERTGSLAKVFRRLAEHYEHQAKMKRLFIGSLIWPGFQLAMALFVVGFLIWVVGFIAEMRGGEPIDLLGFGLVGTSGLIKYLTYLAIVGSAVWLLVWATWRGVFWARPLQRLALRIPGIGGCLEKIALARFSWSLHLMLNVEMDLRDLMPLALRSTGNDHYIRHSEAIVADIVAGREICEALHRSRAFPHDFLAAVEVGEHSGLLVESMGRLSAQYEELAQDSLAKLTRTAAFLIWALVAALIVMLIFRIASFYVNMLNDAARGI